MPNPWMLPFFITMKQFLKQSKTFNGITFSGCYNMPLNHFEAIYFHYLKTNENLLDDYSTVIYKCWDNDHNIILSKSDFDICYESINKIIALDIDGFNEPIVALKKCIEQYKRHQEWDEYHSKRARANVHISKGYVRNKVFDLYGEKCLKCESTENIQIDHIVPVKKGGSNEIDNLQPLCNVCNASKGTKIEDYRK